MRIFREKMEDYEEVKWGCVLVNSALVVLSLAREREILKLFQEKWENICFNRVIVHIFAKQINKYAQLSNQKEFE